MALFDAFSNLSPDQTQGLLSAAAALLQAGGPSRTTTSFGQALGSGLQAFQQGMQGAQDRRAQQEQQRMNSRLLGLRIQDAESDIANQAAARARAQRLQEFYQSGGGANIPQLPSMAPTIENAQALQAAQSAAGAGDLYSQRLNEAQRLRAAGFGPEADAVELQALKFREEFDQTPRTGVDEQGKPFQYVVGKGGTVRRLDGILPRDEMKLVNLGGREVAYNPFALAAGQSFARTASPDALLSASTARRGQDLSFQTAGLDRAARAQAEKAPTEFQGKSAAYGLRAQEADRILNSLQGQYSPAAINSKLAVQETPLIGGALGAATNFALSDADQQAEQAQRDFVNAVLRQESGAAIGQSEFRNAQRQYFPQPGDSENVITQKARNRQLAIQGLQSNAGRARMTAAEPTAQGAPRAPLKGQIVDGYRFKGGDPSNQANWEKQ